MSIADKLTTIAENEQKVYDAGAKSEHDKFWDAFQENGKRVSYSNVFLEAIRYWSKESFKPKYNIAPKGSVDSMFFIRNNTYVPTVYPKIEMDKLEDELGIKFDFSNATNFSFAFADGGFWRTLNVIDISKATNTSYAFYGGYTNGIGGYRLAKINELIVSENTPFYSSTFGYQNELTKLIVSGTIAKNGFNVQHSEWLNYASLVSIKNALADKSQDTSGTQWIITVGSTNKAKYTEADLDEISAKGWTVK
jgi:hypothetical protein